VSKIVRNWQVAEKADTGTNAWHECLCHGVDKLLNGGTDILVCVSAPFNPFSHLLDAEIWAGVAICPSETVLDLLSTPSAVGVT
jgi:hypothetical protein